METQTSFALFMHVVVMISVCHAYRIVYLDRYMGNLKLIELPDLTVDNPSMLDLNDAIDITPNGLQCGNPDVSPDGTKIVFGAITPDPESWDIYMGDLNIVDGRIDNLQLIINTNLREEDPRFSYDGNSFVYKAGVSWNGPVLYNISMYDFTTQQTTVVVECPSDCNGACASGCNHCELWGPAYHPCGDKISYTARVCENHEDYDEVYVYDLNTQQKTRVTDNSLPDMYSHWKRDGTLLFSRKDGSEDLYLYDPTEPSVNLYLSVTASDDDAYAFKQDNDLFLFIGLADNVAGYELFIVRDEVSNLITTQMTSATAMLGPVVFSTNIAVTTPDYCTADNPVTTAKAVSTLNPAITTSIPTTPTDTTLADTGIDKPSKDEANHYWMMYFNYLFVLCLCLYQCIA